jgi:hypothetical protein
VRYDFNYYALAVCSAFRASRGSDLVHNESFFSTDEVQFFIGEKQRAGDVKNSLITPIVEAH